MIQQKRISVRVSSSGSSSPPLYVAFPDTEWNRAILLRRGLQIAVAEENFSTAAMLQDALATAVDRLGPYPRQQYAQLEMLHDRAASVTAKLQALRSLRVSGNLDALADVSRVARLGDDHQSSLRIQREAKITATAIRARQSPPAALDLCGFGASLLMQLAFNSLSATGNDIQQDCQKRMAFGMYSQALNIDPKCVASLSGRGAVWYHLRQYDSAVADLEAAVAIDPWHDPSIRMLALARGQLKQFSAAYKVLKAAVLLNPGLADDEDHRAVQRTLERWETASLAWASRYWRVREAVRVKEERLEQLEALFQQSLDDGMSG